MESLKSTRASAFLAVGLAALFSASCATKKYVQTKVVRPLEAKISGVDKKTDENSTQITEVDRKAEAGISDVNSKAENAAQAAAKAGKDAQDAQTLAQKGVDQASVVAKDLDNVDNYQPVKDEKVLFRFNRSDLTSEEKQKLDDLAQSVASMKHYVLEVQGYTDKTGTKDYNLELSRRRADSVVRYLTEVHNIPLVKIHMLGYGPDKPAQPNNTREGRKENRRVEVRILAPQLASAQSAQTQSTNNTGTQP